MRRAHRRGTALAVLLDFDGTLAKIVRHPDLARLPVARRRLLLRLAAIPRVSVGVVSGRALGDLRRRVAIPGLYYAGTGGMELDLAGTRLRHPREAAAIRLVDRVERRLRPIVSGWRGAWLERKPVGVTIHFRALDPHAARRFSEAIDRCVAPLRSRLAVLRPRRAIELLPRAGWHKGSAVERIVAHVGASRVLPLYAGDDANDRDALEAVAAAGGVSIGVGPDAPAGTTCRVASPAELHRWLAALARGLSSSRPPGRSPSPARRRPSRRSR